MTLLKPLLQLMSPAGARARLSVLIFHRVLPEPDRVPDWKTIPGLVQAKKLS